MKVLCIDASPAKSDGSICPLEEGKVYNAWECPPLPHCYQLAEIPMYDGFMIAFTKMRFMPLSEIDETELVKEKAELA